MGIGLTWRVVSASVAGTSHLANGSRCDDSCWALGEKSSAGEDILLAFVSDGAGSASHGGHGAEIAMEAIAEVMAAKLDCREFGVNDELAVEIILTVRSKIQLRASSLGLQLRDFACTLLGVVSLPNVSLVMQIGDGGIVISNGDQLEVPIAPMTGEYANMTHFVTDENAVKNLITKTYQTSLTKVAVFSDGIQRIALNMASNTAHEPFFKPFFEGLTNAKPEIEDQLCTALAKFLDSDVVNQRTDDDKTLVIAVRT